MNRDKDVVALATQRAVQNASFHSAAPAANRTVLQLLLRQRDHRTRLVEVLHADRFAVVAKRAGVERGSRAYLGSKPVVWGSMVTHASSNLTGERRWSARRQ